MLKFKERLLVQVVYEQTKRRGVDRLVVIVRVHQNAFQRGWMQGGFSQRGTGCRGIL